MKELKFRAWDGKKIIEDVIPASETSIIEVYEYEHQHVEVEVIEQYTGLKDRNGKEIYEGDIVEYDWYIIGDKPAYRTKEQVVFDDMGARLDTDRIRFCTNVEVIGNIHEDADLLGGGRNEKA